MSFYNFLVVFQVISIMASVASSSSLSAEDAVLEAADGLVQGWLLGRPSAKRPFSEVDGGQEGEDLEAVAREMEEDDWYKQRPRVADEDSPSEGGDLVDLAFCDFGAWTVEDDDQDAGAAAVFDVEDTAVGTSIARGQVAAHEGYSLPSGSSDIEVLHV